MNDLVLDQEILTPNPPQIPKFESEDYYFYLSLITLGLGVYLAYNEDRDCFHLFTLSVIFACTYNIIKTIKQHD